jgi:hypothetical protein
MEGVQMSNHLGDTNKKLSETPRMDASAHDDGAIWQTGCDIERELNAANERIKRMEESLESIREYWNRDNNNRALVDACWYAIDTASEALEAKEVKP